jgi:BASS family bile acid:Na+ symporter
MQRQEGALVRLLHFVHDRFLWLMIGTYIVAAIAPGPGLWIRGVTLGEVELLGGRSRISLSMILLASLLLNAGFGVERGKIFGLMRRPGLLGAGLIANLLIPITLILAVTQAMASWHNADEVQCILVGLALVASMPIAGSSTAWAQNADGETALSLGLVLFSTFLSPITTPLVLHSAGLMATGDYSAALSELATSGTTPFLVLCVLVPSLLGIGLRRVGGNSIDQVTKPALKLINFFVLLLLNYSNAAVSLPQAVANPDPDFIAVMLAIVVALCSLAFVAGFLISQMLRASPSQRVSLMFGLGMNNNGTGLVLASMALSEYPRVLLPIIVYNLVQHLVAGFVDRFVCRPDRPSRASRIVQPCWLSRRRVAENAGSVRSVSA